MTTLIRATVISVGLVWSGPRIALTQAAPPPPAARPPVAPPPPAAQTPPAQAPAAPPVAPLQPATSPAPTPPVVEIPSAARAPGDSDVALCVDGSWIKVPGVPADCGNRGGLKVAMPAKPAPPPAPSAQPVFRATPTPAAPPPTNATARCSDGSYLFSPASPSDCVDRGGVVVRFLPPPAKPTPPVKRPDR